MIHGGDIYNNQIELDFSVNRNPIVLPKSIPEAMQNGLLQVGNYPEYSYRRLKKAIADYEGVDISQVVCGNGASELFMAIVHALKPRRALIVQPGFFGYEYALKACECEIVEYSLNENDGFIVREDYLNYIKNDIELIFLGNPNNPTGRFIDERLLEKILSKTSDMNISVVMDECFFLLGRAEDKRDKFELIKKYPNLIIIRAFTKLFAIPGIRTGYALCSAEYAEIIGKHIPEWNVSVIADEAGRACCDILQNTEYTTYSNDMISIYRRYLINKLGEVGIKVFKSEINFVLIKTSPKLGDCLLQKNILIRDCSNYKGLGQGYYRLSVQDEKTTDRLIEAIRQINGEINEG